MGFRYRKNVAELPGKPDIVFRIARVAIFCDGDFWHGRNWDQRRQQLISGFNASYWVKKIEANILRDRIQEKKLSELGWTVIRVWESDVLRNTEGMAKQVATVMKARTRSGGHNPGEIVRVRISV